MAATGYSPIQLYYSTTASAAPTAGNLASGELAINITDGKLYYKDNAGAVQLLSTSTTANGTANGVLYLNGSKVATSGTALTFDGTNFANTQSSNASLGLRVTNSNSGSSTSANTAYSNGSDIHEFGTLGTAYGGYGALAARDAYIYAASTRNISLASDGGAIKFGAGTGAAEQMRLTSTGLGIGTSSPARRLVVQATDASTNTKYIVSQFNRASSGTAAAGVGGQIQFLAQDDAGTQREAAIIGWDLSDVSAASPKGRLFLGSRGVNDAVVIDNSGNLGLGVTPSAWNTGGNLQLPSGGNIGTAGNGLAVVSNSYYNGSNSIYVTSNPATAYTSSNGQHAWYTAASGTAGNAITFTQAMTLDSSGNLGIGTSSPSRKLTVWGSNNTTNFEVAGASGGASFNVYNNTTGDAAAIGTNASTLSFGLSGIDRMFLTTAGNLGLGVTPSAWGSGYTGLDIKYLGISNTGAGTVDCSFTQNGYYNGTNWIAKYTSPSKRYSISDSGHIWYNGASATAGTAITFTQAMTLDASGNLGIGTSSPSYKLEIYDATNPRFSLNTGASGNSELRFSTPSSGYQGLITYSAASNFMAFYTSATERMRMDSSGNLGLGVTPNAWTLGPALQVSGSSVLSTGNDMYLSANAFYGSSAWTYRASSYASQYYQLNGQHVWRTAASGTAGNAITFTQAMTLDASGNLLVGTTSTLGKVTSVIGSAINNCFYARFSAASGDGIGLYSDFTGTTGTAYHGYFRYNGTAVGSITSNSTTTTYATSSDYRLKENQQPLTGSGAFIDALKPKTWNWKVDGSKGVGFIAHEVQEVSPASVVGEKDGEQMQAMEYGSAEFIANIVAELQSLRKRLADAGIA